MQCGIQYWTGAQVLEAVQRLALHNEAAWAALMIYASNLESGSQSALQQAPMPMQQVPSLLIISDASHPWQTSQVTAYH